MRKISEEIARAFYEGRVKRMSNTHTDGHSIYLHGNEIARKLEGVTGRTLAVSVTLAGWNTNTTRDRLNALEGVKVNTKQGQAFLNGEKWEGGWIAIKA